MTSAQEEFVARADALRPSLAEAAAEADRNRRLSDETFAAVRDAGLITLGTPRAFGGAQTSLRTMVEVSEALARGCGPTGWVAGVLNTGNWITAQFPAAARAEVWGQHPAATVAGVTAPGGKAEAVDGGFRVTAKWAYASGSLHADWAAVGIIGPAGPALILVPATDYKVDDTWHVTGMRGTGSNTIVVEDIFVPEHRLLDAADLFAARNALSHPDEPLYRASLTAVFGLSLIGAQLGQVSSALDLVLEKAPKRSVATTTYASQVDFVPFQVDVAEAATKIRSARLLALDTADEVDDFAAQGRIPDPHRRMAWRMALTWASRQLWEAVDQLVTAHGTSSFAEVNPLQRIWRDQAVATRHAGFALRVNEELLGKTLLGVDPSQVARLV
jgi:3-hydroxy-9,10-secoandrosta-1,3,5(10)-triene-9,17-dione monooxygenase